jgi:hypothetical protein
MNLVLRTLTISILALVPFGGPCDRGLRRADPTTIPAGADPSSTGTEVHSGRQCPDGGGETPLGFLDRLNDEEEETEDSGAADVSNLLGSDLRSLSREYRKEIATARIGGCSPISRSMTLRC